jgi:hypothetical protein
VSVSPLSELLTPSKGSRISEELDNFTELLDAIRELLDGIGFWPSCPKELDNIIEELDTSSELDEICSANSFPSSEVPANVPESPQPTANKAAQRQSIADKVKGVVSIFLNLFIVALLNVLGKREKL